MFDIENNWNVIENENRVYSIDIEEDYDDEELENEITLAFQDLINDFCIFLSDNTKKCLRIFWW